MKPGDLVVRIWLDKPKWDMIGIIISRKSFSNLTGGTKWLYGIKWNNRHFIRQGTVDQYGSWSEQEFEVINEAR